MKKLFLLATVILAVFLTSTYSFSENFPKNDPLPDGVMYKGVNEDQWKTIKKIGDPLDCQKKLYDFQKIQDYHTIFLHLFFINLGIIGTEVTFRLNIFRKKL